MDQIAMMKKGEKISIAPKPIFTTLQVFHQLRRKCIQQNFAVYAQRTGLEKKHVTCVNNSQKSQQCV